MKYRLSQINKSKHIQDWKGSCSWKPMLRSDPHLIFNCISISPILKAIHHLLYDIPLLLCFWCHSAYLIWMNFTSTRPIYTNINSEIIKQKNYLRTISIKVPAVNSLQHNTSQFATAVICSFENSLPYLWFFLLSPLFSFLIISSTALYLTYILASTAILVSKNIH